MTVPRRLSGWRLVAMLLVALALCASSAHAQTRRGRVKIGPASVYEHASTGSEILATVPEGATLEILKQEGGWCWVLLPRDAHGVQRGGYIAAYVLDIVTAKGEVRPDVTSTPQTRGRLPLPPMPPSTRAEREPRYFASIGGGGQVSARAFADNVAFPLYDETGQFHAFYATPNASALDATLGIRLSPRFVLAVAFWHSTSVPSASVGAVVPHPFNYDQPRSTTSNGLVVGRIENDGHLQLTWLLPLSNNVDLSVFGGPSLFYLRQDLVNDLSFREVFPYDSVGIAGFDTIRKSKAGFGINAGADVTVMVWRYFGVGVGGRYARGTVKLASASAGTIDVQVGGAQVSGGLRVRF